MKLDPVILVVFCALAAASFVPAASGSLNECQLTGATDASGEVVAPPCVATYPEEPLIQGALNQACGQSPVACPKYYVFLVPEQDGQFPPFHGDAFEPDPRIIWAERNSCAGLQRGYWAGCNGRDVALIG